MKFLLTLGVSVLCLLPQAVSAHQPRIVESDLTAVEMPEVSKAYYGKLSGTPHVFLISESEPFDLYVNVLVPDVPGAKTDVSAAVVQATNPEEPLILLNADAAPWSRFYEEFGQDSYLAGKEERRELPAGEYEIRVWSSNNDSTYVLAVGEAERFTPREIIKTFQVLPVLKRDFFQKPAYEAYLTPILGGPIAFGGVIIVLLLLLYWRKRNSRPDTL